MARSMLFLAVAALYASQVMGAPAGENSVSKPDSSKNASVGGIHSGKPSGTGKESSLPKKSSEGIPDPTAPLSRGPGVKPTAQPPVPSLSGKDSRLPGVPEDCRGVFGAMIDYLNKNPDGGNNGPDPMTSDTPKGPGGPESSVVHKSKRAGGEASAKEPKSTGGSPGSSVGGKGPKTSEGAGDHSKGVSGSATKSGQVPDPTGTQGGNSGGAPVGDPVVAMILKCIPYTSIVIQDLTGTRGGNGGGSSSQISDPPLSKATGREPGPSGKPNSVGHAESAKPSKSSSMSLLD